MLLSTGSAGLYEHPQWFPISLVCGAAGTGFSSPAFPRPAAHFVHTCSDLRQIPLHLAPAIPHGVTGARMECSLEGPHSVLQIDDKQRLLGHGRAIVECREIRKRISVVAWFRKDALLVTVPSRSSWNGNRFELGGRLMEWLYRSQAEGHLSPGSRSPSPDGFNEKPRPFEAGVS